MAFTLCARVSFAFCSRLNIKTCVSCIFDQHFTVLILSLPQFIPFALTVYKIYWRCIILIVLRFHVKYGAHEMYTRTRIKCWLIPKCMDDVCVWCERDRVKGRARDKMYHHHEWHEIKLEWLRQRNILKYYVECDSWTRELNGVHIQCHLMVDFKWSLLYICQESLSSIAKASRNLIELDKVPEDFPRNVPVTKKKKKPKSGNQIKILFAIVLKW